MFRHIDRRRDVNRALRRQQRAAAVDVESVAVRGRIDPVDLRDESVERDVDPDDTDEVVLKVHRGDRRDDQSLPGRVFVRRRPDHVPLGVLVGPRAIEPGDGPKVEIGRHDVLHSVRRVVAALAPLADEVRRHAVRHVLEQRAEERVEGGRVAEPLVDAGVVGEEVRHPRVRDTIGRRVVADAVVPGHQLAGVPRRLAVPFEGRHVRRAGGGGLTGPGELEGHAPRDEAGERPEDAAAKLFEATAAGIACVALRAVEAVQDGRRSRGRQQQQEYEEREAELGAEREVADSHGADVRWSSPAGRGRSGPRRGPLACGC